LENSLSISTDDAGKVDRIVGTIEQGHDGDLLANLLAKYGKPKFISPSGEVQWTDGTLAVAYVPATPVKDGLIVVITQARNQLEKAAREEVKSRPL